MINAHVRGSEQTVTVQTADGPAKRDVIVVVPGVFAVHPERLNRGGVCWQVDHLPTGWAVMTRLPSREAAERVASDAWDAASNRTQKYLQLTDPEQITERVPKTWVRRLRQLARAEQNRLPAETPPLKIDQQELTPTDYLRRTVAGQLLRSAVQQAMTCPDCGGILDTRSAVYVDAAGKPGVSCFTCFAKSSKRGADVAKMPVSKVWAMLDTIIDGQQLSD